MPSFPLEQMSIGELEHAATAPRRFLNLVKGLDVDYAPRPFRCRDLVFRQCPSRTGTYAPRGIFLVPGGRFLLATTEDFLLTLWDLGYNMNVVPKPYPVATSEVCGRLAAGIGCFGDRLLVGAFFR